MSFARDPRDLSHALKDLHADRSHNIYFKVYGPLTEEFEEAAQVIYHPDMTAQVVDRVSNLVESMETIGLATNAQPDDVAAIRSNLRGLLGTILLSCP